MRRPYVLDLIKGSAKEGGVSTCIGQLVGQLRLGDRTRKVLSRGGARTLFLLQFSPDDQGVRK